MDRWITSKPGCLACHTLGPIECCSNCQRCQKCCKCVQCPHCTLVFAIEEKKP